MKQVPLPGIALPAPEADSADSWPDMAHMLGALFVCELPPPAPCAKEPTGSCSKEATGSCSTAPHVEYSKEATGSYSKAPHVEYSKEPTGSCAPGSGSAALPLLPITVWGLGLHRPELSPPEAACIRGAEVLAGGKSLLARMAAALGKDSLPAKSIPLTAPLDEALCAVEQEYRAGKRVLVLADGDPLFFGIGATLARRLGHSLQNPSLRIVPGISALQEACARLALPWHDVRCVSLHGRKDFHPLHVAVLTGKSVCLLTDACHSPDKIARHLLDRGVDWFDAHIFVNLHAASPAPTTTTTTTTAPTTAGGPAPETDPAENAAEQHFQLSLREVVAGNFGPLCTLILCPVRPARRPVLGIPDTALATEGSLMTKAPVRAAALSLLRIEPGQVVWDVGAGSGAVALEAAALAHEGCVIAVERSAGRALCIKENRRRFGAANLEIFTGEAPHCLHELPTPQRVFVGGGLNHEETENAEHGILAAIARRLAPGGRVVVSCVLLGSLYKALEFFRLAGWPLEVSSIQPTLSAPLAGDMHLNALNPVFLLAAQKPLTESLFPRH